MCDTYYLKEYGRCPVTEECLCTQQQARKLENSVLSANHLRYPKEALIWGNCHSILHSSHPPLMKHRWQSWKNERGYTLISNVNQIPPFCCVQVSDCKQKHPAYYQLVKFFSHASLGELQAGCGCCTFFILLLMKCNKRPSNETLLLL